MKRNLVVLVLAALPVIVSAATQPALAGEATRKNSTAPAQHQATSRGTAHSRHPRKNSTSSGKHHPRHHHQTARKQ